MRRPSATGSWLACNRSGQLVGGTAAFGVSSGEDAGEAGGVIESSVGMLTVYRTQGGRTIGDGRGGL